MTGIIAFLFDPSIFLSLAFGVLSVYFFFRGNTYPGQIDYYKQYEVGLLDSNAETIPGLSITYNGDSIDSRIIILRAGFLNSGRSDLDPRQADYPLSVKCPNDCKWLSARVLNQSNGLKGDVSIESDRLLVFRFDSLFRRKEAILFEAVLSTSAEAQTRNTMVAAIDHRIPNTNSVRQKGLLELPTEAPQSKPENIRAVIPGIAVLSFGLFMFFFLMGFVAVNFVRGEKQLGFDVSGQFTSQLMLKRASDTTIQIFADDYNIVANDEDTKVLVNLLPPFTDRTLTLFDAAKTGIRIGAGGLGFFVLIGIGVAIMLKLEKAFNKWKVRPFMFSSNQPPSF